VQVSATCAFLRLEVILTEDTTVLKKNPIDERHPGGCWNIRGCWRSNPSESTWLHSSKEFGIGQTEKKKHTQKVLGIEEEKEQSIAEQVIRLDLLSHTARFWPLSEFPSRSLIFPSSGFVFLLLDFLVALRRRFEQFLFLGLFASGPFLFLFFLSPILSLFFHTQTSPLHNQRVLSF
jgi:hypothetical protein